ncbi:putative signal transducing protein [Flavobacterium terrae]|uniref:Putative signal transducing protein n=1 Tax=Flavobacterium terrae TaxID=415425 RepID=A0A1M6D0I0_9FLAO|nr:DUF2007 domain-containing protein [Flavobacterium terrae]SHI66792.1 Putative signal transducing protein [Flavobacterium terrae]
MALMKIFSGSEILAQALQSKLEAAEISTVVKNNIQSGLIAGFGTAGQAVEVFIQKTDLIKANPIIEEFKMSI